MTKRKLLQLTVPLVILGASQVQAGMISSQELGNDPAKARLCVSRVKMVQGKSVPFFIDSQYVKSARSINPDTTFIAIDGISPQLVECYLRRGTGRYEPASYKPLSKTWRLASTPQKFEPAVGTMKGREIAGNICKDAAVSNINRSGYDHYGLTRVVEIEKGSPAFSPGKMFAGKKAQRDDVVVEGTAFYAANGPDMAAVKFTCLLSPMLDVKAVKIKK